MSRYQSILIGGDVFPLKYESIERLPRLFDALPGIRFESAATVVNLETPLHSGTPRGMKAGYAFGADPRLAGWLAANGIHGVNLANNHCMDQREQGLTATLAACTRYGIGHFGAGETLAEAGAPHLADVEGRKVAFLGMADPESGRAGACAAGPLPLDLADALPFVRTARDAASFLVLLLHTGAEYYPYPTPSQQRLCRFLAREGADVIVCQHSHCCGAWERHGNSLIVYGQGNLFTEMPPPYGHDDVWNEGFLVEIHPGRIDSPPEFTVHPYGTNAQTGPTPLSRSARDRFERVTAERNARLDDPEFLAAEWQRRCMARRDWYFSKICGHGRLLRAINRRTGYCHRSYSAQQLAVLENLFAGDAHREAVLTLLEALRKERGIAAALHPAAPVVEC